jgi:hypothetical protein
LSRQNAEPEFAATVLKVENQRQPMTGNNRTGNRALLHFILLPMIFLTVALLGGVRIDLDHALIFVAPPLITLVLAILLLSLLVRGRLVELHRWLATDQAPLTNVSHGWLLLTLFFASAQAFNSALPERGLLHWLFSFFFLWTLWNNQFSVFDARRLLRSLIVLFGTAFVVKHILLANLYGPEGGWLTKVAGTLLRGASLGTLDATPFAPASGYLAFFTLALYLAGLFLLAFHPPGEAEARLAAPTDREFLIDVDAIRQDKAESRVERLLP